MGNYKIKLNDTLSALAARFNTSVSALARANNIANPNLILTGARLTIPGHGGADSFQSGRGTSGVSSSGGADLPAGAGGNRNLAEAARQVALSMGGYNSQSLCATGVSRALSSALGLSVRGNGNTIDDNLPRDRFRQVNLSLEEALKIPGLVLTWEKTSTAAGSIYGHTAITAGNGRSSYSDFVESNTLANSSGRYGLKVFVPI